MHPVRRLVPSVLLVPLIVLLAACGSSPAPGGGSGTPDGDPSGDPVWEIALPDGSSVQGLSVTLPAPNRIVLADSQPAGWSVTLVTSGTFTSFTTYFSDETPDVGATVDGPSASCSVGTGASGSEQATLVLGDLAATVPSGNGSVTGVCFGESDPVTTVFGFGGFE